MQSELFRVVKHTKTEKSFWVSFLEFISITAFIRFLKREWVVLIVCVFYYCPFTKSDNRSQMVKIINVLVHYSTNKKDMKWL